MWGGGGGGMVGSFTRCSWMSLITRPDCAGSVFVLLFTLKGIGPDK